MPGRKATDETGNRYGRLLVIKREGSGANSLARWLCRCDCGNDAVINGCDLRRGNTRSCGCLRDSLFADNRRVSCAGLKRKTLPEGEAAFRRALRNMKKTAMRRGIDWGLTEEETRSLMDSPCHYCGSPPNNLCKSVADNGDYYYSGIDRKDSSKGYVLSNVVPCCFTCNKAKGTMSEKEFMDWIDSVVTFREKKGPPSIPAVV